MAHEELAELISSHAQELGRSAAQELAKNIPTIAENLEETLGLFVTPYEVMADYLRTGDQAAYKQFYQKYFTELIAQGNTVESLQLGNKVFYAKVRELVEHTWTSEADTRLRNSSLRRLDSLQQMDIVTAIATNILKAKNS